MNKKTEPFFRIKELLPELCSADLELVILDATKILRKETFREAIKTIQLSTDPEFIKRLRKL